MAPLPANATARYFVDYTDGLNKHSILFRSGNEVATAADLGTIANEFIAVLQPLMYNGWQILGARFSAEGTNLTLPVVPPNQVDPGQVVAMSGANAPRYVSFVGRGITSGRRIRFFVFGLNVFTGDDYRIQPGEVPVLDDARAVLADAGLGLLDTVAGDNFTLYQYVNVGFNSYFERKQRV